jgi:hypothetical protein
VNLPKYIIPIIVVVFIFAGYHSRRLFTQPTTGVAYESRRGEAKLVCIVEGLKCKGTANFFNGLFRDTPGITNIETFASEHKAVFHYRPQEISPADIKFIMEQKVTLRDGSQTQVFKLLESF